MKYKMEPFMKMKYGKSYWRMFLLGMAIFVVILAILAAVAIVRPRMTAQKTPHRTLETFVSRLNDGDYQGAGELEYEIHTAGAQVPDTLTQADFYEALDVISEGNNTTERSYDGKFEVLASGENDIGQYTYYDSLAGEERTVTVTYVYFGITGYRSRGTTAYTFERIPVVKEDGKWYILCPPMAELCVE